MVRNSSRTAVLGVQMPSSTALRCWSGRQRRGRIFATAYDEHAIPRFEVHAVDYLLKPLPRGAVGEALQRAKKHGENRRLRMLFIGQARLANPGTYAERIVVKDGTRVHFSLAPA